MGWAVVSRHPHSKHPTLNKWPQALNTWLWICAHRAGCSLRNENRENQDSLEPLRHLLLSSREESLANLPVSVLRCALRTRRSHHQRLSSGCPIPSCARRTKVDVRTICISIK